MMVRALTLIFVLIACGAALASHPSSDDEETYKEALVKAGISIDWSKLFASGQRAVTSQGDLVRRTRRSTGLDWNVIVDNLLVQARKYIVEEGKDEINIPDIDERFEKRFGFVKASGRFQAWEGRVNSLTSIQRTGDVSFTSVPGQSVTLTSHLGFGHIRVRYGSYKAEIWRFGPRGRIQASVGSNSVRLRLRMDITGESSCKLVVEEVTVERMDGFDVDVTGLGPLNWLTSKIVTWVAKKRRGDIMANAERALRRALERSVEKLPCDPDMIHI